MVSVDGLRVLDATIRESGSSHPMRIFDQLLVIIRQI